MVPLKSSMPNGVDGELVDKDSARLTEKERPLIGEDNEEEEEEEEEKDAKIPRRRWVMNGAVMFGREFCYAMETALVTPVLLQIGLPERYYSLTWFLSPILGLLFTPLIGSASDRCTLRLGRRRPFILMLCVGVLLGVALFLNGSLIGLSTGDTPGSQPIGIVLTVVGVVVLDFCADASEGPIRAYLLDVADTEEQDMALNIHAFSAGLGGAVGYMLGGLDWTDTALGRAFRSQEQVLFFFAAVIFTVSVALHMFSIPEWPYDPAHHAVASAEEEDASSGSSTPSWKPGGQAAPPSLDLIPEEDACAGDQLDSEADGEMEFFCVDRHRSKSDSALAMPDGTIQLDSDLDLGQVTHRFHHLLPLPEALLPSHNAAVSSPPPPPPPPPASTVSQPPPCCGTPPPPGELGELQSRGLPVPTKAPDSPSACHSEANLPNTKVQKTMSAKGGKVVVCSSGHAHQVKNTTKLGPRPTSTSRPHPHTFYRQPSFTFSYYGRVGAQRFRIRRLGLGAPKPITSSRSLNDLSELQQHAGRRAVRLSASSLSSEGSESEDEPEAESSVRLLWLSMFKMPRQLWRLCVCHLLTWFSIIAEAVFYTDFMGQVIYHGDPMAPANSTELQNYHRGVQMGCWGLVAYATTAAVCSAVLQKYMDNFDLSIKIIYILGTLGFSIGTAVMAIFPNVYVAMVMISSMGIISMSISYCPYALLGQYHEIKEYIHHSPANSRRGFGIDCAILSCQVYISQILVASALGSMVEAVGSVRVIPMVASGGSFLGFLTACFLVIYPGGEASTSEQQGPVDLSEEAGPDGERTTDHPALLSLPDREGPIKTEYHSNV